jgi:hypothetical protein
MKYATTAEGAQVMVATGRKPMVKISADYSSKFTDYCRGAIEPTCKSRPGCTWMGGKTQRCQRGVGAAKSVDAQKAENAAYRIQSATRKFLEKRRQGSQ